MTTNKRTWDWDAWLRAVQSCPLLSERQKEFALRFKKAFKRRGQWIGPWEIEGAPNYDELTPLLLTGFAHMDQGFFVPLLDPLPGPNSMVIGVDGARLIRQMRRGRFSLYRIQEPSGVCVWKLYNDSTYQSRVVDAGTADSLAKKGLIEWNSCTGYDGKGYQLNQRRLAGVRGFRAPLLREIASRIQQQETDASRRNDP